MTDPADSEAAPAAPVKPSERAKATGDLDRVTDLVEEQELDASAAADKMRAVLATASTDNNKGGGISGKRERASEADVKDVKLLCAELEIDEKVAERALLGASGDVGCALRELMK